MTIKAKLATTIAALCMVICLLTVGVLAATSATVTINGTVNFQATDVIALVKAKAEGTKGFSIAETTVGDFDAADEEGAATGEWTPAVVFSAKDEVITLTLTVENKSVDREIKLTFAPTLGDQAITAEGVTVGNVTAKLGASNATEVGVATAGEGGAVTNATATVTITLEIADRNLSVNNVSLGGTLLLENQAN